MKVLYIGQYTDGTTSKMRANQIKYILNSELFDVIDTHIPFHRTSKFIRSFGFRFKKGPLVWSINSFIRKTIKNVQYDLTWVDKGIFLDIKTLKLLRSQTQKLVHFTPDMAFLENKSKYFNESINHYDYVISTKIAEKQRYLNKIPDQKYLYVTQGFSKKIHKPIKSFHEKEAFVSFIGLAEPSRFEIIEFLLQNEIPVKLAGKGWDSFVKKHKENSLFTFLGESLINEEYAMLLSSSLFSLGLLSKRFLEFHTTRTFEIPACGTALLTEFNDEIGTFFNENEVIYYNSKEELVNKIKYFMESPIELQKITENGYNRVWKCGYDYESILKGLLNKIME